MEKGAPVIYGSVVQLIVPVVVEVRDGTLIEGVVKVVGRRPLLVVGVGISPMLTLVVVRIGAPGVVLACLFSMSLKCLLNLTPLAATEVVDAPVDVAGEPSETVVELINIGSSY